MTTDACTGTARPTGKTTVSYGPLEEQIADLFLPTAAPSGLLLLLIHGGDWQQAADRGYIEPTATALAGLGHAVASLEYRRLGGGGGWPATFEDIEAAVSRVPAHAAAVAAEAGVVLRATVVVGHSAGGHLGLWAASQAIDAAPRLVLAVGIGPTADLALAHELGATGGAAAQLLGGDPADVPDVLAKACPSRLTPTVPIRLVHGDEDPVVPVALSRSYVAKVEGDVSLAVLHGDDHFIGTVPDGLGWTEVLAALDEAAVLAPAAG